jgi:outer membrane biosynthesis protein TonB
MMRSVFAVGVMLSVCFGAVSVGAQSATPGAGAGASASASQSPAAVSKLVPTGDVGTRSNPMVVVESVAAAQLRKHMATEYPQAAIDAKISGNVKNQALIGKGGMVIASRVVWGPQELRAAAQAAVAHAQYTPLTLDGKPIYMATTVRLVFAMDASTTRPTKKMGELIAQTGQAADADALRADLPFSSLVRTPGADKPTMADDVKYNVTAAKLIHYEKPFYPPAMRDAHVQGAVILHGIIQKDGTMTDLRYVSGPQLLAPAAIDAVKKWRYAPTILGDEPVDVDTTVMVVFTLD